MFSALVKALQDSIAELAAATSGGCGDIRKCCDVVLPAMLQVRQYADELEGLVADDLWPLPTYQEMLFIKQRGQEMLSIKARLRCLLDDVGNSRLHCPR